MQDFLSTVNVDNTDVKKLKQRLAILNVLAGKEQTLIAVEGPEEQEILDKENY